MRRFVASMWRLGLRGGGGGGDSFPERPDEPDCIYYLRTGVCGYGSRCRFNHPRNRAPVINSLSLSHLCFLFYFFWVLFDKVTAFFVCFLCVFDFDEVVMLMRVI